jgi:hypothetical protein
MRCSGIEAWGRAWNNAPWETKQPEYSRTAQGDKTNSEQRNLPAKGFRPGILLLGMGAVMSYGWYKLIGGMREAKYVCPSLIVSPFTSQYLRTTSISKGPGTNIETANSAVRRCGLASTSFPSSRPKKIAIRSVDTWLTRSVRRSCWATMPRFTTATGSSNPLVFLLELYQR